MKTLEVRVPYTISREELKRRLDEALVKAREASAEYGISTELVHLPGGCARSIKLALPERDADIAEMCRSIENAGAAGLRGICWHFCVLENQRSQATPGRGGTSNSSLYAADYDNEQLCEAAQLNGGYRLRTTRSVWHVYAEECVCEISLYV